MKTTTPPATAPNMTREYRKELRALETQIRRAANDSARHERATQRAIAKIETAAVREIRSVKKQATKLAKGTAKQLSIFAKRQAILLGRLAS